MAPRIVDNHTTHSYRVNVIGTERPVLAVLQGEQHASDLPAMKDVEAAAVVRYVREDGLVEALRGADALFVYDFLSTALPGAWHAADRLRWVHIAGAGVDPVLFP